MNNLPDFLLTKEEYIPTSSFRKTSTAFIDKTIQKLARLVQLNHQQVINLKNRPYLLKISIQTKLIVFFYFIVIISLLRSVAAEIMIGILIIGLHLLMNGSFLKTFKRILVFTFFFGFMIALPASLNIFTYGELIYPVVQLNSSYDFWIYHIPEKIGFTREGLNGLSLLTLRVFNSISISILLITVTPFNNLMKGLKIFHVPDSLLMIFSLSWLYINILAISITESYLAMKARIIGNMENREVQQLIAGRITHIFRMSRRHFEKTYQAMLARGFNGDVALYQREKMTLQDYIILASALLLGIFFFNFTK